MLTDAHGLMHYSVALALGLLIGAERERRKVEQPHQSATGIRSFALASLLGAGAFQLGGPTLLAIMLIGVTLLLAVSYRVTHPVDRGLTTEMAFLLTVLLGGLSMEETALASALAVASTFVLASRKSLHEFVRKILTEKEWIDALILAAAALVILPLAPDRAMGLFLAFNPRMAWMIVILILSISAAGYVVLRVIGPRFGLPLTGLASGFVSSVATIGAMGNLVRERVALLPAGVAGATLSSVATILQLVVVLEVTSPLVLDRLGLSLLAAGLVAFGYGLFFTLQSLRVESTGPLRVGEPFSIKAAVVLAATLSLVMWLSAALLAWLGPKGLLVGAALGGLVDAHAAAVSVAALVAAHQLLPEDALIPIWVAITANLLTKMMVALATGHRAFMIRVIPGLVLMMIAGWASLLL